MKCEFKLIDENTHKCVICGFILKSIQSSENIHKVCSKKPITIVEKVVNVVKETADWVAAGLPIVDETEQKRREEICNGCDKYKNGKCELCGCYMAVKTRIKTSHCPIDKW